MEHRQAPAVYGVAALLIAIGASFPIQAVALKPLTCEMKALLVGTSAMLRDAGMTRGEVRKINMDAGDLTAQEIDAVLNVAFNPGM